MSVSRWDPFQDLLAIQEEMNQAFGRARQGQAGGRVWAPALDISERKDAYVVTVEVPGVSADDLDIRVERRYGSFRRSITLPSQVKADAIEASFENGVLEVVVPKAEEAKPKKITVRAGGGRQQVSGTSTPAGDA
jgi:HSP20 family protein